MSVRARRAWAAALLIGAALSAARDGVAQSLQPGEAICRSVAFTEPVERVRARCMAALAVRPDSIVALRSLGHAELRSGNRLRAEHLYRDAIARGGGGLLDDVPLGQLPPTQRDLFVALAPWFDAQREHWQRVVGLRSRAERFQGRVDVDLERALARETSTYFGEGHQQTTMAWGRLADMLVAVEQAHPAIKAAEAAVASAEAGMGAAGPGSGAGTEPHAGLLDAARNGLGVAAMKAGEFARAGDLFERTLAQRRERATRDPRSQNRLLVAQSLHNLGVLAREAGDLAAAERWLDESIGLLRQTVGPNHVLVANPLAILAITKDMTGDFAAAQRLYREVIALRSGQPAGDRERLVAMGNLGASQLRSGLLTESEQTLRKVMQLLEATGQQGHPSFLSVRLALAEVLERTGRQDAAADLRRSFEQTVDVGLPAATQERARALTNMVAHLGEQGRLDEAAKRAREALDILTRTVGQWHPDTAVLLNNLASIQLRAGDRAAAMATLARAQVIAAGSGVALLDWRVSMNMMYALAPDQGPGLGGERDLPMAIFYGKRALGALQTARANLSRSNAVETGLDAGQRFFEQYERFYADLADRLIESQRHDEALAVLAAMREHEFREYTRSNGDAQMPQALSELERRWADNLDLATAELARVIGEMRTLEAGVVQGRVLAAGEQHRLGELGGEIAAAEARLLTALNGARQAFSRFAGQASAEVAAIPVEIGRLRGDLPSDTALLQVVVLPEQIRLLVLHRGGELSVQVPVGRAALDQDIRNFLLALRQPGRDVLPYSRRLYDALVAPIDAELRRRGVRTLLVSTSGALRYVPFAALHDGQQWLVERLATAVYSPITGGKPAGALQRAGSAAGFGVSKPIGRFTALPSVQGELAALIRDAGNPVGALPGQRWLDEAFSRDALAAALQRRPTVLHIASHFVFSPVSDRDSELLLGDGQRLSLAALRADAMSFSGIDLVTLSACETALGRGTGAEVDGLASVVRRKGAEVVLASLWRVDDSSTADLMRVFYQRWATGSAFRAEALRAAQLAWLADARGEASGVSARGASLLRWFSGKRVASATTTARQHPYFWASFLLIGQWY